MLPLLLFPLPAGWLCLSCGFILLGMQSCPGLFPQLCAKTLTSVKMVTSLEDWMLAADFLMLIYLDFGMILDGFCVIPSADGLTGGVQREAVIPKDWRFAEWERNSHMCSLIVCLFYRGHAATCHGRDCQHRHHPCCCMTPFSLIYIRPL